MKTAERILQASRELLNEQGTAQVTTNAIADAADLSVGNLYYHYKNKDDILFALFEQFDQQAQALLNIHDDEISIEHWTRWWERWFELVSQNGFLFHDQRYLLNRNGHLQHQYDRLMGQLEKSQKRVFKRFKLNEQLVATDADVERIAREVTFIAFFWQDFIDARSSGYSDYKTPFGSALHQTLGLLLPYLKVPAQMQVEDIMRHVKASA